MRLNKMSNSNPNLERKSLNKTETREALMGLSEAANALSQLNILLASIAEEAGQHSNIGQLAALGGYVANDVGNLTDCIREGILNGKVQ